MAKTPNMATLTFTDHKGVQYEVPVTGFEVNTQMNDVTSIGDDWKQYLPGISEVTISGIWNPPANFDLFAALGPYWTDG